jgi:competence ComEA-like helix-hairpin-helix protein
VVIAPTASNNSFRRDSLPARPTAAAKNIAAIDINLADTSQWIALPGVGSKLAFRIVNFRDKLGGFYSIEQVGETYALPDSTFQKIKSRLRVNGSSLRTININTATVEQLKMHPYIKWNIANAMIQYRQQHGPYQSVEDLQKIAIVTPEWLQKVAPYFTVQ